MQMTKAQAIAELEHIYEILPLIAEAVKEEKKPINQYGKTSYFRDMYGQSMGTVNNQELGDTDGQNENIGDFLKAIKPSQGDLNNLFDIEAEEQENEDDAEKAEETDEI